MTSARTGQVFDLGILDLRQLLFPLRKIGLALRFHIRAALFGPGRIRLEPAYVLAELLVGLARVGVGRDRDFIQRLHGVVHGRLGPHDVLAELGDVGPGFVGLFVAGGGAAAGQEPGGGPGQEGQGGDLFQ